MKLIYFLGLIILVIGVDAYSSETIDQKLKKKILKHKLQAISRYTVKNIELYNLGKSLFSDYELSGNKNISCMTCHNPDAGSSDGLAFPLGAGAIGEFPMRKQGHGLVIARSAPTIYNMGQGGVDNMFWDGRVEKLKDGSFRSPDPVISNYKFTDAIAIQAVFPITSPEEMLGSKGNDMADSTSNLEVWTKLISRLIKGPKSKVYKPLFSKAYPMAKGEYDVSHIGNALSEFQKGFFQVTDTPYDRYLNGDLKAMSLSEKKGLLVFTGRGKCVNCHNGPLLSDMTYKSVGTPEIYAQGNEVNDVGRFAVTGIKRDLYKYKTPALRNISKSAPYMHNGVYQSLSEVIDHYDNVKANLIAARDLSWIQKDYKEEILIDRDVRNNKLRFNLISIGALRKRLNLTESEKTDLLNFLKISLTQVK